MTDRDMIDDEAMHLLLIGDFLAKEECGLLCHVHDLDRLSLDRPHFMRHSCSAEMALPVLVKLLRVVLCYDGLDAKRTGLAKLALKALEKAL